MKQIMGLLTCIVTFSLACHGLLAREQFLFHKYMYPINNRDPHQFGYDGEVPPELGPRSIALANGCAYIVDDYHRNLKKVELATGKLETSNKITSRQDSWPVDVFVCNNSVLVSDDWDSLIIFDTNLVRVTSVYSGSLIGRRTHELYFFKTTLECCSTYVEEAITGTDTITGWYTVADKDETNDSLYLYYPNGHVFTSLSCSGELTSIRDAFGVFPDARAHGKKYSLNRTDQGDRLQTELFDVPLVCSLGGLNYEPPYLCCIYVEYDAKGLVLLEVQRDSVIVHYYERISN